VVFWWISPLRSRGKLGDLNNVQDASREYMHYLALQWELLSCSRQVLSAAGANSPGAIGAAIVMQQEQAMMWRAVLHNTVLHQLASAASQLSASGTVYAIAFCGAVCTLDVEITDGVRCPRCFPLWPTDQDMQVIARPPPPLPKRIPWPVPRPRARKSNHNSGWFGS
jgi:hypothetical protein